MSELLERWSAYELNELDVLDRFWPAGDAARKWEALLIGKIIGQHIAFSDEEQRDIEEIWSHLDGTFDPDKQKRQRGIPPPEQMKHYW